MERARTLIKLDKSISYPNEYVIVFDLEQLSLLFSNGTKGSYGVFPARLLGLEYADYLRFCRDVLGAELTGKGSKYIVPYFSLTKEVQAFIKLLNDRVKYLWMVKNERENIK